MTHGSGAVLGSLEFTTIQIEGSKLISTPELVLNTDKSLCGKP